LADHGVLLEFEISKLMGGLHSRKRCISKKLSPDLGLSALNAVAVLQRDPDAGPFINTDRIT
jgi:hypothetical protein